MTKPNDIQTSHILTLDSLMLHRRPFYATLIRVESIHSSDEEITENALFMTLPLPGHNLFAYTTNETKFTRTSIIKTVEFTFDYIKVVTRNSIYVLKDLRPHDS